GGGGDGGKVRGTQAHQLVRGATTAHGHPRVLLHLERQSRRRELLDDLEELTSGQGDRAAGGDLRGHGHASSHFQVGRRQPQRVLVRLEEHVGKNGQRLSGLDDVVNHLETFEKGIPVHMDFHVILPWLEKKRRKASS